MAVNNSSRIVIWCSAAPAHRALANKIAAAYNVTGIVVDKHSSVKQKRNWLKLPGIIWDRWRFRKIYGGWDQMKRYYQERFSTWPAVPMIEVNNINDLETGKFTSELKPDLIIVSGTKLIRSPLVELPATIGIINLHTGLSPYVKGGPNCTNWCIVNNDFHLTGSSIMWLNAGIDTGNLITTETVDITQATNLPAAHKMVMEHAHDLYLRSINYLISTAPPYNSVSQDSIGKGKLYLYKMWNLDCKKKFLVNWKNRKNFVAKEKPIIVPLPAFSK